MTNGRLSRPRSIRWRLTLWYGLALASVLAVFCVGSLAVLSRALRARSDHHLEEARGAFVAELVVEHKELGDVRTAVEATFRDTRFRDTWAYVFDSTGALIGRSDGKLDSAEAREGARNAGLAAARHALEQRDGSVFASLGGDRGGYRASAGLVEMNGALYVVATVQSREILRETIQQIGVGFLLVIPLAIALAAGVGYVLARRALEPMSEMSRRARAIGAGNLHERLPVANPSDEVGQLAGVVNDLLARLEASFTQQRRFVADASHELRTPVTTVCAEADVALGRETRTEAEYRDSLRVVGDAGRRLSRIVEDLFLLARADAGHLPLRLAPLYLDELCADVARSMRAAASARGVRLVVEAQGDAPAVGDAALLERLLLNLLDNAIKYTRTGSEVRVRLTGDAERYTVQVTDAGGGIPADAIERVFERFYRVDRARARDDSATTSGAGLGLAIGRWIAEAHGGTLTCARSDESGSEFVTTLPRVTM